MNDSVTIIIPAYNEAESIGSTLDEIKQVLSKNNLDLTIIVVDDGSTDQTSQIAKSRNVTVIRHEENRGYGAALKTGIRKAVGEFVLIIDADSTYPPEAIPQLIKESEIYDMVVGARRKTPRVRAFAKWFLIKLSNYLSETKIPDLNSGLRLIRKSLVEQYYTILPNGFSFTTTISLALLCNGYAVKYIPIDYRDRKGTSKIRPIRHTWDFLILIIRTIVCFNPLRVFLPIGLFLIILGIFIGFYSKLVLGKLMDVTTITAVTTGTEIVVIGFLADLIARRSK